MFETSFILQAEKYPTSPLILPSFANLWAQFSKFKDSECAYTKALAAAAQDALNVKMDAINKKVAFISAYLDPQIRVQLKTLCKLVPRFSYDKVFLISV